MLNVQLAARFVPVIHRILHSHALARPPPRPGPRTGGPSRNVLPRSPAPPVTFSSSMTRGLNRASAQLAELVLVACPLYQAPGPAAAGPDTSRRVARPPRRSPLAALAGSCGEAWPTWPRSRTGPHNSMGRISSASGCAAAAGAAISTSQIRQRRRVRAQLSRAYLIVSHRPSFRGGRGAGTLIGEAHLPREGLRHWRLPAGTGGRRPFGGDDLELVFQRSAHSSRATPSNPLSPSASRFGAVRQRKQIHDQS
jgi:hypothetical protein